MVTIGNKQYYTIEEASRLANVNIRTLRRWIAAGRLSDFIFPFRTGPNEVLYRLEPPEDGEPRNKKGEWLATKGGAVNESISST